MIRICRSRVLVTLRGLFGDASNVDYYEVEYTTTPAVPASWAPIPPPSAGGFSRVYLDISPGPTVTPQTFGVNFSVLDAKNVAESLEHFEANNPPPAGVLRVPVGGQDVLVNLLTAGNFGDGVYYFRVKGYTLSGTQLINPRVLLLCNTKTENSIALPVRQPVRRYVGALYTAGLVTDTAVRRRYRPRVHDRTRHADSRDSLQQRRDSALRRGNHERRWPARDRFLRLRSRWLPLLVLACRQLR